ncbi:hypothetical protein BN1221_02228 [Brenneria goodwinii]|uniref:Uncharacterized protein n=1 Tax=Brenneria goodwinii TaxID=1109412 RepID=A0A0G4JV80_9GAMM|nr:hypothetical protein BN1221_02228 [Brenneria goodwinii]
MNTAVTIQAAAHMRAVDGEAMPDAQVFLVAEEFAMMLFLYEISRTV